MGSIISKKKKNHVYYYYVESARVNGKPRIVTQKYLSRAERIAQAFEKGDVLETPNSTKYIPATSMTHNNFLK